MSALTVQELIEKLKRFDPMLRVMNAKHEEIDESGSEIRIITEWGKKRLIIK